MYNAPPSTQAHEGHIRVARRRRGSRRWRATVGTLMFEVVNGKGMRQAWDPFAGPKVGSARSVSLEVRRVNLVIVFGPPILERGSAADATQPEND